MYTNCTQNNKYTLKDGYGVEAIGKIFPLSVHNKKTSFFLVIFILNMYKKYKFS